MSTSRTPASTPLPRWLRRLGLSHADIAGFGPDLHLDRGALLALHHDAADRALAWERITSAANGGRLRYWYPGGAAKGTVCSKPGPACPTRLLVACGPLPALCARAFDGARADTVYVGLGGCWTAAAAARAAALIEQGAAEVVLAVADNQTGARSLEAAIAFLRGARLPLRRVCRRTPPAGTWPETLLRPRRGGQPDRGAPA